MKKDTLNSIECLGYAISSTLSDVIECVLTPINESNQILDMNEISKSINKEFERQGFDFLKIKIDARTKKLVVSIE